MRNSFVFEMVGLDSFLAPRTLSKVWGIALVCWLWSVTTVFLPVHDCHDMGKSQSSTNEDFFLTDENDGKHSYGLKSAVRENLNFQKS